MQLPLELSIAEAAQRLYGIANCTRAEEMAVAKVLREAGYEKRRVWVDGAKRVHWFRVVDGIAVSARALVSCGGRHRSVSASGQTTKEVAVMKHQKKRRKYTGHTGVKDKVYTFNPKIVAGMLGMPVVLEPPDPRLGTFYSCRDQTKVEGFYPNADPYDGVAL